MGFWWSSGYDVEKKDSVISCSGSCCLATFLVVLATILLLVGGIIHVGTKRTVEPVVPKSSEASEAKMKLLFDNVEGCSRPCRMKLAESIPTGLSFNSTINHSRTHEEWLDLINKAESVIEIASLYWNLNSSDYATAEAGRQVFEALANAARRGVTVLIVQSTPSEVSDNAETAWLAKEGLAKVRTMDFPQLLGGGVLHTKFIIVDEKHVYLGSANMDWKSLTEVKELGIVIRDCDCMASDLEEIFNVYWILGQDGAKVPREWSYWFWSRYSSKRPNSVVLNSAKSEVYFSGSPPPLNPYNRENDLDTILRLIHRAQQSICISVMDYIPVTLYTNKSYWPDIDDALRQAAYRNVGVKMLVSKWDHTEKNALGFLKSLVDVSLSTKGSIQIRWFKVPETAEQKRIGHARVNHNKYMVTDKAGYIGTSNWAGDYFINTAGVGLVVTSNDSNSVQEQLQEVFDRDWNSPYAMPLV